VFEAAALLFERDAKDSGETPWHKVSRRWIFAGVVFDQTIVGARGKADVVAVWMAF